MKAIRTKYHGPTNTRSSRLSASDGDGNRVTISYPSEVTMGEDAHAVAAVALCRKMNWTGTLIAGWLCQEGNQHVFVFEDDRSKRFPIGEGEVSA